MTHVSIQLSSLEIYPHQIHLHLYAIWSIVPRVIVQYILHVSSGKLSGAALTPAFLQTRDGGRSEIASSCDKRNATKTSILHTLLSYRGSICLSIK